MVILTLQIIPIIGPERNGRDSEVALEVARTPVAEGIGLAMNPEHLIAVRDA